MNLPNLSQPIVRNTNIKSINVSNITPSGINWRCVALNCGAAGLGCAASFFVGGIPAVVACLGFSAPSCVACFT